MNSYERTIKFVHGEPVDRPPFMPLVIQLVPIQYGVPFLEFAYDADVRAKAYLNIVEKFDIDCVLPAADFYEQLEDFGQKTDFTESGPRTHPFLTTLDGIENIPLPEIKPGTRQGNRIETLKKVAAEVKGKRFIFGVAIGPFTEYCNARDVKNAMKDMKKDRERMRKGIDLFFRNDMQYIQAQLDAGADGILVVEPNCSLVSPKFYEEYIQPLHKALFDYVHSRGAIARLHICGDTTAHLPYTLGTGVDILDVDTAADQVKAAQMLGPTQCLCGNLNTSEALLFGKPEDFGPIVQQLVKDTGNRIILAAGCEVPPATSVENLQAFHDAVAALAN